MLAQSCRPLLLTWDLPPDRVPAGSNRPGQSASGSARISDAGTSPASPTALTTGAEPGSRGVRGGSQNSLAWSGRAPATGRPSPVERETGRGTPRVGIPVTHFDFTFPHIHNPGELKHDETAACTAVGSPATRRSQRRPHRSLPPQKPGLHRSGDVRCAAGSGVAVLCSPAPLDDRFDRAAEPTIPPTGAEDAVVQLREVRVNLPLTVEFAECRIFKRFHHGAALEQRSCSGHGYGPLRCRRGLRRPLQGPQRRLEPVPHERSRVCPARWLRHGCANSIGCLSSPEAATLPRSAWHIATVTGGASGIHADSKACPPQSQHNEAVSSPRGGFAVPR